MAFLAERSIKDLVVTRKNSVTIVINDADSLIIMPPTLGRDALIAVLQAALSQVVRADTNVLAYDSLDYEN